MTPDQVMDVAHEAMMVTVLLAAPLLLAALLVGLIVGVFQAATQIQEMTLSFIPKLIALAVAVLVAGPWMLQVITEFTRRLITGLPGMLG